MCMCVLLHHHLSTSQQRLMGQYIDNTLSYKGLYYGQHSQLPSTRLVTLPQLWSCILIDVASLYHGWIWKQCWSGSTKASCPLAGSFHTYVPDYLCEGAYWLDITIKHLGGDTKTIIRCWLWGVMLWIIHQWK